MTPSAVPELGCRLCRDEATPARIVELRGRDALVCDDCGRDVLVAIELLPDAQIGDRVLVHAGVAIGRSAP